MYTKCPRYMRPTCVETLVLLSQIAEVTYERRYIKLRGFCRGAHGLLCAWSRSSSPGQLLIQLDGAVDTDLPIIPKNRRWSTKTRFCTSRNLALFFNSRSEVCRDTQPPFPPPRFFSNFTYLLLYFFFFSQSFLSRLDPQQNPNGGGLHRDDA